jgi:hypothetical protein
MAQRPVAIGLTLCEQVIVEAGTGNVTPVNCFTHRTVRTFPSEKIPFVVFSELTDGAGQMNLDVVLHRLDTFDEVLKVTHATTFKNQTADHPFCRANAMLVSGCGTLSSLASSGRRDHCSAQIASYGEGHMNPDDVVEASEPMGFDSRDCVNVIIDVEGDNTIRPCRPEMLKYLMAERDRINRYRQDSANGT